MLKENPMPIYEYQCSSCGHQMEVLQKIAEEPLTECPHCHKNALNKLMSATSFQLKGTGWYATDFRNKDKPKSTPPKDGENNSSSGSDTGTSTPGTTGNSGSTDNSGSEAKSTEERASS